MPALLEGRRVVKSSRATYCLALLSLLVSVAVALQSTIAQAADGDTTTTVAIPPADTACESRRAAARWSFVAPARSALLPRKCRTFAMRHRRYRIWVGDPSCSLVRDGIRKI